MADEKNEKEKEPEKSNACGIIGIVTGWMIPLLGVILGIIALSRGEKNQSIGIIAICVSVFFWILGIIALL